MQGEGHDVIPEVTWASNLQTIFISFSIILTPFYIILILFDYNPTIQIRVFQIYFFLCSYLSQRNLSIQMGGDIGHGRGPAEKN